jgi:hypothetical protein
VNLLAEVADHLATNNDGYNIMGLCIKTLDLGSKVSIELLFSSFGFLPTRFLRQSQMKNQRSSGSRYDASAAHPWHENGVHGNISLNFCSN